MTTVNTYPFQGTSGSTFTASTSGSSVNLTLVSGSPKFTNVSSAVWDGTTAGQFFAATANAQCVARIAVAANDTQSFGGGFSIPSTPVATNSIYGARWTSGYLFKININSSGVLTLTNFAGTVTNLTGLPTISALTAYYMTVRYVVGTSTTGSLTVKVYDNTLTQLGSTYTATNLNLGTTGTNPTAAVDIGTIDTTQAVGHGVTWDAVTTADGSTTEQFPSLATLPVGNAGPDQTVDSLSTVTLAGSATNTPTSRAWTQTSGTTVTLSSTTIDGPTFTAPADPAGQTLVFSYTATNGAGTSTADTVTITVNPQIEWIMNGAGTTWVPTSTAIL